MIIRKTAIVMRKATYVCLKTAFVLSLMLLLPGCIWQSDQVSVLPKWKREPGALTGFTVMPKHSNTLLYPADFYYSWHMCKILRIPGGDHPAQLPFLVCGGLLRLPTFPFEYIYNSRSEEFYSVEVSPVLVDCEKTRCIDVVNDKIAKRSSVSFGKGRECALPFNLRLVHNPWIWNYMIPEDQGISDESDCFDVMFVDSRDNLWVKRNFGVRLLTGVRLSSSLESDMLVAKVSLVSGQMIPVVILDSEGVVSIIEDSIDGEVIRIETESGRRSWGFSSLFSVAKANRHPICIKKATEIPDLLVTGAENEVREGANAD